MDLRTINSPIAVDYTNSNNAVSILLDASQHLTGKSLFCRFDCSQAYHCLQMANQRSVEILAFFLSSRTFGYKGLAKSLSRSLSVFSSFMRVYFDPVVKTDRGDQNLDDIGTETKDGTNHTRNIRAFFKCTSQAESRLTKNMFWSQKSGLLWQYHPTRTVFTTGAENPKGSQQAQISQIKRSLAAVNAILQVSQKQS